MNPMRVKVAAVQAAPVFLNKPATVDKACALIAEAGRAGAQLAVFPEAFISAYPDWVWLLPNNRASELNTLYTALHESAVTVPDEATAQLCEAAKAANIYVCMGMNERNTGRSGASLYNSLLYIDAEGTVMGVHRKLIPTGGERTVWSQGDGSTMHAFATPFGTVGGLICWENLMPLARQAMYEAGVQFYAAPTWDKSEIWTVAMRSAAREGGMAVISCCQTLHIDAIPDEYAFKRLYPEGREWINGGRSFIAGPGGAVLAGPLENEEGILYAEIDTADFLTAKRLFDPAGHYSRPDVFRFDVLRG